MTFHFLRKAITGIYIHQLTVIEKLKLIADKNCGTVGVSCDMNTSTDVAMLTGVEVFFLRQCDRASLIYSSITHKMPRYTMVFITINALHVSGGSSAHHQELKTVYTASGIYIPVFKAYTFAILLFLFQTIAMFVIYIFCITTYARH
jgi:hypothetical protein